MRRVIVESPFAGTSWFTPLRWWQRYQNVRYARRCVRHALSLREAPFASHLLYTQPGILDDNDPHEREWGIAAGLILGDVMDATVVYEDRGISRGMRYGIEAAQKALRKVEFRSLKSEGK